MIYHSLERGAYNINLMILLRVDWIES